MMASTTARPSSENPGEHLQAAPFLLPSLPAVPSAWAQGPFTVCVPKKGIWECKIKAFCAYSELLMKAEQARLTEQPFFLMKSVHRVRAHGMGKA